MNRRLISVLIIDNSFLIRLGLRRLFEEEGYEACGEAANAGDALAQVRDQVWNLIVLDMCLPHNECLYIFGEIRQWDPAARVLMTSAHHDSRHAGRAHCVGSTGYVGKDSPRESFLRAASDVASGKTHFGEFQLSENGSSRMPIFNNLSPREQRVMLALGEGKRPTNIAAELNLSAKTISTYKRRVLNKLHLTSDTALVSYVLEHKLLNANPGN